MNNIILNSIVSFLLNFSALIAQPEGAQRLLHLLNHPENSQGSMAGLVTDSSALLQTRLTLTNFKIANDYVGSEGWGRFLILNSDRDTLLTTPWKSAIHINDFIIKILVENLEPNTTYFYRLHYGRDTLTYRTGKLCKFRTLGGPNISAPFSFAVVTGMNYDKFHNFPGRQFTGIEKEYGYPAAETITKMEPDFFVGTGDNVYFDSRYMPIGQATDLKGIRNYYHLQFSQPRMVEMFSRMSTYWEKDDHDYRYNDADTTGQRKPSHKLGIKTFREQLPVVLPNVIDQKTYGTYRVSKELQIWLVEGRDYRSPNKNPDGPQKTIWGSLQKEWLKRTLLKSDAVYKVLISPTPLIGPDDSYKSDNHVNQKGFRHERDEFFSWLTDNGFKDDEFLIICGDRHWQYHSIEKKYGFQEFSCGAFVDANSRLGRKPGDPKSTDPNGDEVNQIYTSRFPSGGFLFVKVEPGESRGSKIIFNFLDERGEVNYTYEITKQ